MGYLAYSAWLIAALGAVMLWNKIGASIGCCELAVLAYVQALRSLRTTCIDDRRVRCETCRKHAEHDVFT
jgi:hypothetical protein